MLGSHLIPKRYVERHAMKRNKKPVTPTVIGFDSETLQGPPITLQFYCRAVPKISECVFIGDRDPTAVLLKQLSKLPPGHYRMYGHNLEFDMLSALWTHRNKIRDGSILLEVGKWTIEGRYSKPVFATFDDGARYIELVDSFLWFMTALDRAAELVCPELPKLPRPPGLGVTLYSKDDDEFIAYAMRDAVVAYWLGEAIEKFHRELQIQPQISLASMAAAVFRQHYMKADMFQPPLYQWMAGAAASYHGGVNRVRPGAAPSWHINVSALDLSSAYPDALTRFPAFDNPSGYKQFRRQTKIKSVPELGIYKISGTAESCDWPALFNHDFKPLQGRISDIWVTGFELNEALETREVSLKSVGGFYYDAKSKYSPFAAYVEVFYKLKNDAQDPVMRYMYKILLNALTGKFIQTSEDYTLVDGHLVKIRRAGGLYHPFIASLTTGHTRSRIHQVEHEYKAIHTATDGIFAPGRISGQKKTLGAVVSEGFGDLALFRNKLYIFYTDEEGEGYESQVFKGRYIQKVARHGFQGTVTSLEQMLVNTNRTYKVNKPIKLKTAIRKNDTPNKFVITERKLKLPESLGVVTYEQ